MIWLIIAKSAQIAAFYWSNEVEGGFWSLVARFSTLKLLEHKTFNIMVEVSGAFSFSSNKQRSAREPSNEKKPQPKPRSFKVIFTL